MPKNVTSKDISTIIRLKDEEKYSFKQIGSDLKLHPQTVSKIYHEHTQPKDTPPTPQSIANGVENDPEIIKLKKALRKAEIERKIRELREPLDFDDWRKEHEKTFNRVIAEIICLGGQVDHGVDYCLYCYGKLKFIDYGWKCTSCNRKFMFEEPVEVNKKG